MDGVRWLTRCSLLVVAGAGLAYAPPLIAQTAATPAATEPSAPEAGADGIADIVVTARKRSESLQNVPASVLAFDTQRLASLNAKSLSDLNRVMPNVNITDQGQIAIRGIQSNTRNIGFEAGAAVYVDGVYQGRPIGNNQDLVDIDRVEVLRGPQGTLYGKNTTAGAISLVTVRPGNSFTGSTEFQYAERNDFRVSGYLAGPLIDGLLGFKISAFRHSADGYQKNIATGERYANADAVGGRAELRLTPGSWDIALRGDYTRDDSEPVQEKAVAGFGAAFAAGRDTINQDFAAHFTRRGGGVSLTVEDELGGGYTVTSISAWRKLNSTQAGDDDFTPLDGVHHRFADGSEQYSQEIRLTSPSKDRFSYVLGGYFLNQVLHSYRPITVGPDYWLLAAGVALPSATFSDTAGVRTDSFAAFANADYRITEKLILNLGLRYTNERKKLNFEQVGLPGLLPYPTLKFSDRSTKGDLSPTVGLTYKISPAVTTYAKLSRGFKSGGWNPDISFTPNIGFDAEKVTNYEAGLRTRLIHDRLRVNLTGYYMDYKNLQVLQFCGTFCGLQITNAGAATIKGVEAEIEARPAPWLTLSAGAAYNDARYDHYDNGQGRSYAGQQIANSPRFTGFAALDARAPILPTIKLALQADYSHRSTVYFDDDRSVVAGLPFSQGAYDLVNARVGILIGSKVSLFVFADNLTDKRVTTGRFNDSLSLGLVVDTNNPPRRVGVRLGASF